MRLFVGVAAVIGAGLVFGCSDSPSALDGEGLADSAPPTKRSTSPTKTPKADAGADETTDDTTTTTSANASACSATIDEGSYTLADPTWASGSDACMSTSAVPYLASPITIAKTSDGGYTVTDSAGWVTTFKLDAASCSFTGTQTQTERGGFVFDTALELASSSGGLKITDATTIENNCTAKATVVGTKS